MYEFVFKELRLRLPFSPLEVEIFDYLRLAPSQLHPNSMAFVLAFERLCEYKNVTPTRSLFFRVFRLQRMTKEFGRQSWVSLKQRVSLFDMYAESIRGTEGYLTADASLTIAEKRGLRSLQDFVASFFPAKLVTRAGSLFLTRREMSSLFPASFT
jgi:hypothetical protein